MRFESGYDYKRFATHTLLNHTNLMTILFPYCEYTFFTNYVTNSLLLLVCVCVISNVPMLTLFLCKIPQVC